MQDNNNQTNQNDFYDATTDALQKKVTKVLDTKVDRKSFLMYSAGAVVAMTGIGSLAKNLKSENKTAAKKSSGFGSGTYGGGK